MRVVEFTYRTPVGRTETVLLRDPRIVGSFWRGVECSENGIAVRREGCTEGAELAIWTGRVIKHGDPVQRR